MCRHREADPERRGVAWATPDCYWCWLESGTLPSFEANGLRKPAPRQWLWRRLVRRMRLPSESVRAS